MSTERDLSPVAWQRAWDLSRSLGHHWARFGYSRALERAVERSFEGKTPETVERHQKLLREELYRAADGAGRAPRRRSEALACERAADEYQEPGLRVDDHWMDRAPHSGCLVHRTASGRFRYVVRANGRVTMEVHRPSGCIARVEVAPPKGKDISTDRVYSIERGWIDSAVDLRIPGSLVSVDVRVACDLSQFAHDDHFYWLLFCLRKAGEWTKNASFGALLDDLQARRAELELPGWIEEDLSIGGLDASTLALAEAGLRRCPHLGQVQRVLESTRIEWNQEEMQLPDGSVIAEPGEGHIQIGSVRIPLTDEQIRSLKENFWPALERIQCHGDIYRVAGRKRWFTSHWDALRAAAALGGAEITVEVVR